MPILASRRVIQHVKSIMDASPVKAANMRVLVTGHSLGGVVALLIAHDFATQLGLHHTQVCMQNSLREYFKGPDGIVPSGTGPC